MYLYLILISITFASAVGHIVHRIHNDRNCSLIEINGAQGSISVDRCDNDVLYIGRSADWMVRFHPRKFLKKVLQSCCVLYCEILDNHTHSIFSEPGSHTCAEKYDYMKNGNKFSLCYQWQGVLYLATFYNQQHHYSVTLFLDDVLQLLRVI